MSRKSSKLDRLVRLALVIEEQEQHKVNAGFWQGGGDFAALRAYRAHHPAARIYDVTFNGRTVWMTLKQFAIWREALVYHKRGQRTTLAAIAETVGCSKSTVSRFLTRLDLWRFIDYVALIGRRGGTWIMTRVRPNSDAPFHDAGARITRASRRRARDNMALRLRAIMQRTLQPMLDKFKIPPKVWWKREVEQVEALTLDGRTGGTFTRIVKVGAPM